MRKTLLKGAIFLIVISLMSLIIKTLGSDIDVEENRLINQAIKGSDNVSYYFIGSSRVKSSVDPQKLSEAYGVEEVYNLGMNGSTFLSNALMAEHLIRQKGEKVIFFELTSMLNMLPTGALKFCSEAGIQPASSLWPLLEAHSRSEQITIIQKLLNQQLFTALSLRHEFKTMLGMKNHPWLGFQPKKSDGYPPGGNFLKVEDFSMPGGDALTFKKPLYVINRLTKLSKENNARMIFFLPVTSRQVEEKAVILPLYNMLPEEIKLRFPLDFLDQISDSKLLEDNNHFNIKGAEKYTTLLIPLLKPYMGKEN